MTEIKLVTIPVDELVKILTNLNFVQGSRSQESGEPAYLSPALLAEKFGYSADFLRRRIKKGEFGKVTRSGKCFATYQQTEKYLFERQK